MSAIDDDTSETDGDRLSECSVHLLGSLELRVGPRSVELGAPKQRALFAILVLRANEVVPVDRLIHLLWGERAPRTAAHSVQIYVSDLRKALATAPHAPEIITRQPGYVLLIDPGAVDALRFEQLARAGLRAVGAGDLASGRGTLAAALALWRGRPLADFAYEEFAQPSVSRLEGLRLDALEELAGAELASGDLQDALTHADTVVLEAPSRERARELLMLALYEAGRQVESLRSYQGYRELLAEELGIVPSPQLQRTYERILLHDPLLLPAPAEIETSSPSARNPYKGLRPFREEDAPDFFGRERLVAEALARLGAGCRLLALVGPSGSGKSSAVAAGLVPALRAGALGGEPSWSVARLAPGSRPRQEMAAVLARAAEGSDDQSRRLLVIDQFEALYSVADEAERSLFLTELTTAVTDPVGGLIVVLTLRADHYDRPLKEKAFAELFTAGVLNVLPMTPKEVESAIVGPAAKEGIGVEPALLADLIAETTGQPGSLPLLQYALTEQADRNPGEDLTLEAYHALGGLRAVLSQRADELFEGLGADAQHVAMQVLPRMVQLPDGTCDVRRRVPIAELTDLGLDPIALSDVLDQFGRHRLVSFDRDPLTGAPTVEMAHDALLIEWAHMTTWLERHRSALRRLGTIRTAATDWEESGRDPDYLLTGERLVELDAWSQDSVLVLGANEQAFLRAGIEKRRASEAADARQAAARRRLERRARVRLVALGVAAVLLLGTVAYTLTDDGGAARGNVALLYHDDGEVSDLVEAGFDRAVTRFGLTAQEHHIAEPGANAQIRDLAEGQDLVVDFTLGTDVAAVARQHPDTHFAVLDGVAGGPNVAALHFATEEGSYLAGAAAALTSTTGVIGFVGGIDADVIWPFEAGFTAGARAVDGDVRVLTRYLSEPPEYGDGFLNPVAGEEAARDLYGAGADVVFAAAGSSGLGVFEAAADLSDERQHLWAIGVDSDQYQTIERLPGTIDAAAWNRHILTSVVKRMDSAVYSVMAAEAQGAFTGGTLRFDLANRGVDISYSGGFLDRHRMRLEALRRSIVAGETLVPCLPPGRRLSGGADPPGCAT